MKSAAEKPRRLLLFGANNMSKINRNRLINAVLFFAENTEFCGKIKLFKLLYLMDFEHFRLTGKSITGAEYSAWKMGPVPTVLYDQWDEPHGEFAEAVEIVPEPQIDFVRQTVKPKRHFDDSDFTPRQLRVMQGLADRFKDVRSAAMIDVTHAENGAWTKVWNDGAGKSDPIPYELAISADTENKDAIMMFRQFDLMRAKAVESLGV